MNYWRVRGGFAYQQSPYVDNSTKSDSDIMSYSAGFGYRKDNIFVDFGYSISSTQRDYYLYDSQVTEPALIKKQEHLIAVTIGYRY